MDPGQKRSSFEKSNGKMNDLMYNLSPEQNLSKAVVAL